MLVFTVEPGSPSAEALQLLASWTAPSRRGKAAEIEAGQKDLVQPHASEQRERSTHHNG
jgi:hypothetical protein